MTKVELKRVAMLMTVGTSFVENMEKKLSMKGKRYTDQKEIFRNYRSLFSKAYNYFTPENLRQENLDKLGKEGFPSAEIQSFCFWLGNARDAKLEKVILLPTDTENARKCAEAIQWVLTNYVFRSPLAGGKVTDSYSIESDPFPCDPRNEEEFPQHIADFVDKVRTWIERLDEEGIQYKVLNITGGYKILTPILTLFGFQREDVEVIYQYKDAPGFVQVPPLPMAWDLKTLDEYRSLVRREVLSVKPPARFRAFFRKRDDGQWGHNPFGKLMSEIYEKDRLRRFGYGARLLRWLPKEMRDELDQKIARWEHIWIGDQIPETVEHSRGHSARLMEYAAELLEPLFKQNPQYLSSDELYCLICCLWLHDIGHTGLEFRLPREPINPSEDAGSRLAKFKRYLYDCNLRASEVVEKPRLNTSSPLRVAPFPSLVRLFHNFLSAQRICNPDYAYLDENERDAVALISLYDRAKMPLTGEEWWQDGQAFGLLAPSLEKLLPDGGIGFRGGSLRKERILLLCALLRVLDGLDIQSDRTIDQAYRQERCQRTREEVCYLRRLWDEKRKRENFSDEQLDSLGEQLREFHEQWSQLQEDDLVSAAQLAEAIEDFLKGLLAQIQKAWRSQDTARLEVLSVADRILFKLMQEAHFRKHSRVKLVYVDQEASTRKCKIYLTFDEEPGPLSNEQKRGISQEIWGEIIRVNDILGRFSLGFEGIFEGGTGEQLQPIEAEGECS